MDKSTITSLPLDMLSSILWMAGSVYFIQATCSRVCRTFYRAGATSPSRILFSKRLTLDLLKISEEEHAALTPNGLAVVLARMPFIEHVRFAQTNFTSLEAMLLELAHSPATANIRSLDISFCDSIEAACIEEVLPCFPNMEALSFESTNVVEEFMSGDLDQLFSPLKILNLSYMRFESQRVKTLAKGATNLIWLDLSENVLSEDLVVEFLQRAPNLIYISLDGQGNKDTVIDSLTATSRHVQHLSVNFCEEFTAETCTHLQQLVELRSLRLKKAYSIPAGAMMELFLSKSLESLTRIDLTECALLSDQAVCELALACPHLTHVVLAWCTSLDHGLAAFINCINLSFLDLTGLKQLSNETISVLLSIDALPKLSFLSLKQCNIINDGLMLQHKQARPNLTIIDYYGQKLGEEEDISDIDLGFFATDILDYIPNIFDDKIYKYFT
eukprot:gene10545-2672_t